MNSFDESMPPRLGPVLGCFSFLSFSQLLTSFIIVLPKYNKSSATIAGSVFIIIFRLDVDDHVVRIRFTEMPSTA